MNAGGSLDKGLKDTQDYIETRMMDPRVRVLWADWKRVCGSWRGKAWRERGWEGGNHYGKQTL